MYVLARCNISALLLDVEYMMELMDPALQLGEGEDTQTHTHILAIVNVQEPMDTVIMYKMDRLHACKRNFICIGR